MSCQWSPVPLPKFLMAPRLRFVTSSGSKEKEPKYACLSEAKASHSHKTWIEVSSSASHLLHKGLQRSPNKCRYLLRVLCPVRRPKTTLDCALLKDSNQVLTIGLGIEIFSRASLKKAVNDTVYLSAFTCCVYIDHLQGNILVAILLEGA
jgi:hypothetical protein